MKKLAILMVLLMAAPLFADATVTITDNGDSTGVVTISAPVNIVGMGVEMDVDTGTIDAVSIDQALMNIYMDAAYTEEGGDGYAYGEGTPICDCAGAGETTLPDDAICVSAGMLNGETVAGADGYATVTIQVDLSGAAQLCVRPNALRGGVVDINGDEQTFAEVCEDITDGPICWGYDCFTSGDSNGDCVITADDVFALADAFPPNPYDACADFNQDGAITADDVFVLADHFPPNPGCDPGCVPVP